MFHSPSHISEPFLLDQFLDHNEQVLYGLFLARVSSLDLPLLSSLVLCLRAVTDFPRSPFLAPSRLKLVSLLSHKVAKTPS